MTRDGDISSITDRLVVRHRVTVPSFCGSETVSFKRGKRSVKTAKSGVNSAVVFCFTADYLRDRDSGRSEQRSVHPVRFTVGANVTVITGEGGFSLVTNRMILKISNAGGKRLKRFKNWRTTVRKRTHCREWWRRDGCGHT